MLRCILDLPSSFQIFLALPSSGSLSSFRCLPALRCSAMTISFTVVFSLILSPGCLVPAIAAQSLIFIIFFLDASEAVGPKYLIHLIDVGSHIAFIIVVKEGAASSSVCVLVLMGLFLVLYVKLRSRFSRNTSQ